MVALKFLIGLVVLIFLVTLAVKNMEEVTLYYYFGYQFGPLPLFFALLGSFLLGSAIIWLIACLEQVKYRITIRKLNRQVRDLEEEIQSLKVKSIVGESDTGPHSGGSEAFRETRQNEG